MKKNILATAFFYVFALQAQVQQSDFILGGSKMIKDIFLIKCLFKAKLALEGFGL
jgi:hypothetical protein